MVVRRLSDTFGGLRIKPASLFAPGQTIQSFAKILRERLASESPATLSLYHDEMDALSDAESGSGYDDSETEVQGANVAEVSFDETIAANIELFEGCRGMLAVMVLWEHYHHPQVEINFALAADSGRRKKKHMFYF